MIWLTQSAVLFVMGLAKCPTLTGRMAQPSHHHRFSATAVLAVVGFR